MAAPVEAGSATTNITTAADPWATVNLPGSIAANNVLLCLARVAGSAGDLAADSELGNNWTLLFRETGDASDDIFYLYSKIATGSEGASFSQNMTAAIKGAAIIWRITGADAIVPLKSIADFGTAANPNPSIITAACDMIGNSESTTFGIFGTGGGGEEHAQSFIGIGSSITNVSLKFFKTGSPTDNIIIEIQSDSSGVPSGTVIGTVATVDASTYTGTSTQYNYSCSISITQGTKYWLVLRRSGSRDTSNYVSYPSNGGLQYNNGGKRQKDSGTWQAEISDILCKIDFSPTPDVLCFSCVGLDGETQTAIQPTGYGTIVSANSGTGGAAASNCIIWGASKQVTSGFGDDPGAWTIAAPSNGVTSFGVAILAPSTPPTTKLPWERSKSGLYLRKRRM